LGSVSASFGTSSGNDAARSNTSFNFSSSKNKLYKDLTGITRSNLRKQKQTHAQQGKNHAMCVSSSRKEEDVSMNNTQSLFSPER